MSLSGGSAGHPNEKSTIIGGKDSTIGNPSGYVLDVNEIGAEGQGLQTAHDGKTVLIPQPSSDPNDPLNWSGLKKHVTLLIIAVVAFTSDFGSSIGIVALLPQAVYVALDTAIVKLVNKTQAMGEVSEYHSTQPRRKHFLPGSGRIVCRASVRLLWPTSNNAPLHIHVCGHFGLVRGSNEL